jgi:hypothetical protein
MLRQIYDHSVDVFAHPGILLDAESAISVFEMSDE